MRRRPKRLYVFLLRAAAWALCLAAFGAAFALYRRMPEALASAIAFSIVYVLMAKVYGGFDIGARKSRSIAFSMALVVFFADLAGHLFLCMTDAALLHGGVFVYERPLALAAVFAVQLGVLTGLAYAGNAVYFHFKSPQRCLIVVRRGASAAPWAARLARYPRLYVAAGSACR